MASRNDLEKDKDFDSRHLVQKEEYKEKIQSIEDRLNSLENVLSKTDKFTDLLRYKLEESVQIQTTIRNVVFKNTKVIIGTIFFNLIVPIVCALISVKFFK